MNQDPDPGGPRTFGFDGSESGSTTLQQSVDDVIQNNFIFGSGSDFLESSGHGPLTTIKNFEDFLYLLGSVMRLMRFMKNIFKKFYLDSYPPKPEGFCFRSTRHPL